MIAMKWSAFKEVVEKSYKWTSPKCDRFKNEFAWKIPLFRLGESDVYDCKEPPTCNHSGHQGTDKEVVMNHITVDMYFVRFERDAPCPK